MYKKNILVVEDEGLVAKDIQLSLEDMGYNVVNTVSTGEEAIEIIEMSNPDLVILDIVLKGEMNGIDTAKEILKKYDVPLIYLTAYGDRDTVKMARETKPLGYIVKPYKQEDLYSTIEVALHTHEMKNKMKESERKYRNLVETIHGGLALVDGDENFLYVNEGMCEILGYSREELQTMNVIDFVRKEDRDIIINTTEVKKNGGEFTQYEIVMRRKNGKEAFISVSSSPFLDNNGKYLYTVASFLDITEEKKAQDEIEKILDVEEVLANILSRLINISDIDDNINTLIADIGRLCNLSRVQFFQMDSKGEKITLSNEWCADGVIGQKERLKRFPPHMFPWLMRKIFSDDIINISDLSEVPEEAENEKEFFKKQDVKSVLILPVKVSDKLFGFLSFNHIDKTREWNDEDIALLIFSVRILGALFERKDILDSLVESEMRYHLLVDSLDDYIFVVDNNMDIILTNEKFDELLIEIGVEIEPQKRNIVNIFPSIPDEVIRHYKNVFKTGEMVLTEESRDIGNKQIWLETRKIPVINEKGVVFQVITVMRDITRFIND